MALAALLASALCSAADAPETNGAAAGQATEEATGADPATEEATGAGPPAEEEAVAGPAAEEATDDAPGSAIEASLARAIDTFGGRDMRAGISRLEELVALYPDSPDVHRTFAYALIRMGGFDEAEGELLSLLGDSTATALETGEARASAVRGAVEPEDILALGIVRAQQGDHRKADRLFRAHADLVGPTEPAAARAFMRLSDMYRSSGVEWGDAEAARTRALALDPGIDAVSTLPAFPTPEEPSVPPETQATEVAETEAVAKRRTEPADTTEAAPVGPGPNDPAEPSGAQEDESKRGGSDG